MERTSTYDVFVALSDTFVTLFRNLGKEYRVHNATITATCIRTFLIVQNLGAWSGLQTAMKRFHAIKTVIQIDHMCAVCDRGINTSLVTI